MLQNSALKVVYSRVKLRAELKEGEKKREGRRRETTRSVLCVFMMQQQRQI